MQIDQDLSLPPAALRIGRLAISLGLLALLAGCASIAEHVVNRLAEKGFNVEQEIKLIEGDLAASDLKIGGILLQGKLYHRCN